MLKPADPRLIYSKRKAITALFSHMVWLEREGRQHMFDMFFHVARASDRSGFMWHCTEPLLSAFLDEETPNFQKRTMILVSPHIPWWQLKNGDLIQLWARAISAVPYADDIGQSVVDALLQIACWEPRPIPPDLWQWLNMRPSLPPVCTGRFWGSHKPVFKMVQALEDVETLTSYLLLIWSEWDFLMPEGFDEMCVSIREDFSGERMGYHRKDLLQRLDRILGELGLGLEHIRRYKPGLEEDGFLRRQHQYGQLKEILSEVDREATDALTRESLSSGIYFNLTISCG